MRCSNCGVKWKARKKRPKYCPYCHIDLRKKRRVFKSRKKKGRVRRWLHV